MTNKDIIVIGSSAGGVNALCKLVQGLPADLPAAVFIVQHTSPLSPGVLPQILERAGPLPAVNATDGSAIQRGRIYIAPRDHHLLLERSEKSGCVIRVSRGPKENLFRPSIDALFRSAAHAAGPSVIGVVLTGLLDDGTAGLWAVKDRGGTAVVQDPLDAQMPSMPQSALDHVEVDHCVPLMKMAELLVRLTRQRAPGKTGRSERMQREVEIAKGRSPLESGSVNLGEPSRYTCPECHGVFSQLKEGKNIRFRCHTGHAYSLGSLLAQSSERTEEGLWNVVRSMQESVLLLQNTASSLIGGAGGKAAKALRNKIAHLQQRADVVRHLAMSQVPSPGDERGDKSPSRKHPTKRRSA